MKTQDFKFEFIFIRGQKQTSLLSKLPFKGQYLDLETKLLSRRFSQKTNEQICFSILNSSQDRKTNSFVHFLGESVARQFGFEIFWPLVST